MARYLAVVLVVATSGCGSRPASPGQLVTDLSEATVTIGKNEDTSPQQLRFRLTNAGGTPFTIQRVETPCCQKELSVAQPEPKQRLEPGESTELMLSARPPVVGSNERIVLLHTDIPSMKPLPITIKCVGGDLHPPYMLGVKPVDQDLTGRRPGETLTREMKISTIEHQGNSPWIEALTSNSKLVHVTQAGKPNEQKVSDGVVMRVYVFQVVATVPSSADAPIAAAIDVKVSGPSRMPVHGFLASVRLVPVARVIPSQLSLRNRLNDSFPIDRKVLVISADGDDLRFALSSALPEWLRVHEDPDTAHLPRGAQRFLVQINRPDAGVSVSDATVEFQAADENATIVKIPVRLSIDGESLGATSLQ